MHVPISELHVQWHWWLHFSMSLNSQCCLQFHPMVILGGGVSPAKNQISSALTNYMSYIPWYHDMRMSQSLVVIDMVQSWPCRILSSSIEWCGRDRTFTTLHFSNTLKKNKYCSSLSLSIIFNEIPLIYWLFQWQTMNFCEFLSNWSKI